jgi:nucleotide-binding universal stress UspA family protein
MTGPIVVGFDPLRQDSEPLALAAVLAGLTDANVIAVAAYLHDDLRPEGLELERALREQAIDALQRATSALPEGTTLRALPATSPGRALQRVAEEADASILVVGSAHGGPFGRLLTGSVADRMLNGSPCPVAIAPRGYAPPAGGVRRIGVAFVDTAEGRAAVAEGARIAGRAGASLRAITIVPWFDHTGMEVLSQDVIDEERRHAAQLAEQAARDALGTVAAGVTVDVDVIPGGTTASIVDRSAALDLLVCGSRNYGPLRSVLVGGVSRALAHHARCPLVVVPRAGGDDQ